MKIFLSNKLLILVGTLMFVLPTFSSRVVLSQTSTSTQPEQISIFFNQAVEKRISEDYPGAIVTYTQLLQIDPNNAAAYYNRADARIQLNDSEGAIKDLQTAAKLFLDQGETGLHQRALDKIKKL